MKRIIAGLLIITLLFSLALPASAATVPRPSHLLINQVYGRDDKTDASISHSFIELYNPTSASISLEGWTLKYCVFGDNWATLPLSGNVPASHSYLIVANSKDGIGSRVIISQYDAFWDIYINNDRFKVELVDENGQRVDMVGAGDIDAAEGDPILGISKQKTARRLKFSDIDDNASDFEILDYRITGITSSQLFSYKPRCLSDGAHSQAIFPDDIVPKHKQLVFSQDAGYYEQEFMLTLTTAYKDAVIRYTTDGADPTSTTREYLAPITVKNRTADENVLANISNIRGSGPGYFRPTVSLHKGMVIKAAVFDKTGQRLTNIITKSYFVHPEIFTKYGELPIISIVTEQKNFFDNSLGIYVNGNWNNKGETWERPAHFELFEPDGTVGISQSMGVRIQGAYSRGFTQKSLRFYARSRYDEEHPNVEYDLLGGDMKDYYGNNIEKFENFLLRNSGNDFEGGVMLRDGFMQRLAKNTNTDMQGYRPAVAFINGEFWGIYNIRQRVDNHLAAAKFDLNPDMVAAYEISGGAQNATLNDGDQSDLDYYNTMYSFFNNNSGKFSQESYYKEALTYIDEDNLIDYYITNFYINNSDWPWNNCKFWRYKEPNGYNPYAPAGMDGRFRFVLSDTDFGFGGLGGGYHENLLNKVISQGSAPYGSRIFRRLLENSTFRNKFINRFCDLLNTEFEEDVVRRTLEAAANKIYSIMPYHIDRWRNNTNNMNDWQNRINYMFEFGQRRGGYVRDHIRNQWGLGVNTTLSLSCNKEGGHLRINAIDLTDGVNGVANPGAWSGVYFAGTTQQITAKPAAGYRFEKFIVRTDSSSNEYYTNSISVNVAMGGSSVEAVFISEEVPIVPVTGVTISQSTAVMDAGTAAKPVQKSLQLSAQVVPSAATDKGIVWSTSDESVATVSVSGLVNAVGEGFATITATSNDGGFFATCSVTVNNTPLPTLKVKPGSFVSIKQDGIFGIMSGVDALLLKEQFDIGNGELKVMNSRGNQIFDDENIICGYQLGLYYDGEIVELYNLVNLGDVSGNGECDISDILILRDVLLYKVKLTGAFAAATDVNMDGKVNLVDIMRIRNVILG